MSTPSDAFHQLDCGRPGDPLRAERGGAQAGLQLWIDFGRWRAHLERQLTALYQPSDLEGRLVVAAVNLGSRTIAGFTSDASCSGGRRRGRVVLLSVDQDVPLGQRIY